MTAFCLHIYASDHYTKAQYHTMHVFYKCMYFSLREYDCPASAIAEPFLRAVYRIS